MEKDNMIVSDEKFDEAEREIEAILDESTDFVAEGMGKGLKGLTDTLTKWVKKIGPSKAFIFGT